MRKVWPSQLQTSVGVQVSSAAAQIWLAAP
jgi:hypothetical protein